MVRLHMHSALSDWEKEISTSRILFDVSSYYTDRKNLHVASKTAENFFSCMYLPVDNCTS
jgi:hypothetical protein